MNDWKDALRAAAAGLKSQQKAKPVAQPQALEAEEPTPRQLVERPINPSMPGRPLETSAHSKKLHESFIGHIKGTQRTGVQVSPRPLPPSSKLKMAPLLLSPMARQVGPRLGARGRPVVPVSLDKVAFAAPDMAKYNIRHEGSECHLGNSWQSLGSRSQLGASQDRGQQTCTVGIDFGTAFTKACVQVRGLTIAVHWDSAVAVDTPFLLPGVFSESPDGSCLLGLAHGATVYTDLKTALLGRATRTGVIRAVAFLALVTRYIRFYLFEKHGSVFSGFRLEWFLNIGLPAVPWENEGLRKTYEEVCLAGWRLGATQGPITVSKAQQFLDQILGNGAGGTEPLNAGRVRAFPEFVAQITSYRKSPQRQRDLHILIDVGAGTVDVVTFHIWERDGDDRYSILDASVGLLGTHVLLAYRAEAGKISPSDWSDTLAGISQAEFESRFSLRKGALNAVSHYFTDRCLGALIGRVLHNTKLDRYATSPAWKSGVPLFFCGGGIGVDAYTGAVESLNSSQPIKKISFPLPDSLKVNVSHAHRLSVAHGLSYSALNLGETERACEVPDLPARRSERIDYSDRYIEK